MNETFRSWAQGCASVCVGSEAAGRDEPVLWGYGEVGVQPQHVVHQAGGEYGSAGPGALTHQNPCFLHLLSIGFLISLK